MALHDYRCPTCGWVLADQYRPASIGAQGSLPDCFHCDTPMEWIPQIGRMDALEPGQEFTVYDGQNQPRLIESMGQMHALERESEQQARNGEGQPLRFRALHQSRSNMDANTFGEMGGERPSAEGKRKFGLQGAAKPIAPDESGVPDRAFGPAVNESNCSALKD